LAVNRGHSFADFQSAVDLCRDRRFHLAVHVILGLPGETMGDMESTARYAAGIGLDGIKIHNLYIAKDTALAGEYAGGHLTLQTREEYCQAAARFIELTPSSVAMERICSDVPEACLIAPDWCRDRWGTIRRIHDILDERGSRQGALYQGGNKG
jgi:radical SAM protein (TIGR01212 family)